MGKRIKSNGPERFSKMDIANSKPTHLKFNLSFITPNNEFCFENDEFDNNHKLAFMERIFFLSKENFITVSNYSKKIGLEYIEKSSLREIKINPRFRDASYRVDEGKFAIFRLYPNNNPIPARIIGRLISNVFYVLYIDLKHSLYKG